MAFRFSVKLMGAALVAAFALAGCNKLRFGYEYADWLVIYAVEDNFDLDKSQRGHLKQEVEAYFRWHRAQMLPLYADFLDSVADNVRRGLRTVGIDTGYSRFRSLYERTLEPVAEKSAVFLSGLTPGQVDAWLENQRKKNQKLRKEFSGSLEERLDQRYHRIVDEMEDWTGRLSKEQKGKIKTLNATLPWNGILWLDMREKVQLHLADLLNHKATVAEVRGYLDTYFLKTDSLRTEEFRDRTREFEARLRAMIYGIHNTLTAEQKRRFIQQVEKLARDFRGISRHDP